MIPDIVLFMAGIFFLTNAIIFFFFTKGKVLHRVTNPYDEFYSTKISAKVENIILWPLLVDLWQCRKKHTCLLASVQFPDISLMLTFFFDTETKLFSFGSSTKNIKHNYTYSELINHINYLYDQNPPTRLKLVRTVQLLYYWELQNFTPLGDEKHSLKQEVLQSSTPINYEAQS